MIHHTTRAVNVNILVPLLNIQITLPKQRINEQKSCTVSVEVSISGNRTFSRRLSDSYTQRPSAVQRPAFNTTLFASPLQVNLGLCF